MLTRREGFSFFTTRLLAGKTKTKKFRNGNTQPHPWAPPPGLAGAHPRLYCRRPPASKVRSPEGDRNRAPGSLSVARGALSSIQVGVPAEFLLRTSLKLCNVSRSPGT